MARVNHILGLGFACLLVLACVQRAGAQGAVFQATASASKIGVQDQLQVTFTISNVQNLQALSPGNMGDFAVLGGPFQSQSSNTYINNNQMVQIESFSVTYVLQPKHTGTLSIGVATAKDASGHTYQSNPLNIQVVSGTLAANQQRRQQRFADPFDDPNMDPYAAAIQRRRQQMQQAMGGGQPRQRQQQQEEPATTEKDLGNDLFIKVTVDKTKVHVGEQINASYKLYSRIPMQMGISKLPSLNGFWTQDFEIPKVPKPAEEIIDGKKYQVFLLKKSALFPQQAGTLKLDQAEAEGVARVIQKVKQRSPFADMYDDPAFRNAFGGSLMMNDPFFNNGFFNSLAYRDIKVALKSTPVNINVTPLPDKGKPADFTGAVGDFHISANINKKELTTDDIVNLTISITGSGNLKLIEAPKLNLPNGLDTYDPSIKDSITGRTTTITGTKTIAYAITPHTPGDYDIPPVSFSYYNPQSGNYISVKTEGFKINIKPGKTYTPAAQQNNYLAIKDIHNIETAPLKNVSFNSKPVLYTPLYWSLYTFPLLAFMGIVAWRKKEEALAGNTVLLRHKRATKVAFKRLATAQKLWQQNEPAAFYDEVSKAIWLYLSDKLNIPLSSLSRETATEALQEKKVPDQLLKEMEEVFSECETALYSNATGSQQMEYTYNGAARTISKLEEIFG